MLHVYKDNREFHISSLKEVYKDSLVFSTDRVLCLDLSKLEWSDIGPALNDFNTGQLLMTTYRFLNVIRFVIRNNYKILDIDFSESIDEKSRDLINEVLSFINSDSVSLIVKCNLLDIIKEQINYHVYENDNDILSMKLKLKSSEIEFHNSTRISLDEDMSKEDIDVLKAIFDYIAD